VQGRVCARGRSKREVGGSYPVTAGGEGKRRGFAKQVGGVEGVGWDHRRAGVADVMFGSESGGHLSTGRREFVG
jgi:hypothetical protein